MSIDNTQEMQKTTRSSYERGKLKRAKTRLQLQHKSRQHQRREEEEQESKLTSFFSKRTHKQEKEGERGLPTKKPKEKEQKSLLTQSEVSASEESSAASTSKSNPISPTKLQNIASKTYKNAQEQGGEGVTPTKITNHIHLVQTAIIVMRQYHSSDDESLPTAIQMQQHSKEALSLKTPQEPRGRKKIYTAKFVYKFKDSEKTISIQGMKHLSGNRFTSVKINKLSTYTKLSKNLKSIPDNKLFAKIMMDYVLDKIDEDERGEEFLKQSFGEHYDSILELCYLIFGAEGARDETSLLTNLMFLDLVKNGWKNSEDEEYKLSFVKDLPMSIKKAKGVLRTINNCIPEKDTKTSKSDPKITHTIVKDFLTKQYNISSDWFRFKTGKKELDQDEFTETLYYTSKEEWFNDLSSIESISGSQLREKLAEASSKDDDEADNISICSKTSFDSETNDSAIQASPSESYEETSSISSTFDMSSDEESTDERQTSHSFFDSDNEGYSSSSDSAYTFPSQAIRIKPETFVEVEPLGEYSHSVDL